jgi:ferritin-like metal-binding protein YciE
VQTLRELLEHELQSVASLEHALAEALTDLADESAKKDIRTTFLRQHRLARKEFRRLELAGQRLDCELVPARSPALEGILREKEAFVGLAPTDELLDYYHLQLAARLTHYVIGAYEGLVQTADRLGLVRVAQALRANLGEKRGALSGLRGLAQSFEVAFRQAGGVLEPVPPERTEQARRPRAG